MRKPSGKRMSRRSERTRSASALTCGTVCAATGAAAKSASAATAARVTATIVFSTTSACTVPKHYMASYLSRSDRKLSTNETEAAALLSSVIAYTGRFRLEGDNFITTVDGAWNKIYKHSKTSSPDEVA